MEILNMVVVVASFEQDPELIGLNRKKGKSQQINTLKCANCHHNY